MIRVITSLIIVLFTMPSVISFAHELPSSSRIISESESKVPTKKDVFKEIKVTGQQGKYEVKGFARTQIGELFYTVEDGHNEYISEQRVELDKSGSEWKEFKIDIKLNQNVLPKNATLILNLYLKSKNGDLLNTYAVVLERFK